MPDISWETGRKRGRERELDRVSLTLAYSKGSYNIEAYTPAFVSEVFV